MMGVCQHDWQPFGRHGAMICSRCLQVRHHVHRWQNAPGMPSCIVQCALCGDLAYFSKAVA